MRLASGEGTEADFESDDDEDSFEIAAVREDVEKLTHHLEVSLDTNPVATLQRKRKREQNSWRMTGYLDQLFQL